VKGLAGSVNFIHDEQDRRYVYAQKMAINGNSGGPATVDLGSPLSITDVNGKTVTLVPIAFHGECFLLDILEEPKNGPTAISKLYYLAYGSNLHPVRLREKGRAPSAKLIGVVELAGKSINFYKRSDDKSGKCDLVDSPGSTAYAALYEIPSTEKEALDKVEAVGRGYSEIPIRVSVNSVSYAAFTYIADPKHIVSDLSPYDWYKEMVIAGAKFHRFPSAYIELLKGTPSISDPNKERAAKREILVSKLTTPTSEE
jgi:gamma-glutamylcyclotransferase